MILFYYYSIVIIDYIIIFVENKNKIMENRKVDFKLEAVIKLLNNLKLASSGNKTHEELEENNIIVNLDEISQKITEFHQMVKSEFDEFEQQHQKESDETQDLITTKVYETINALNSIRTTIIGKANDIVSAINGLVAKVNSNTNAIDSLSNRVTNLENK